MTVFGSVDFRKGKKVNRVIWKYVSTFCLEEPIGKFIRRGRTHPSLPATENLARIRLARG